ncbi:hypothetical protein JAAARDRAFT_34280 [Jaapia argillacea MUCL 33604]|uniref:Signal peptidase complex subunit 2 n=1 Tax=Jaapia argillacea MUCL 33604 TaxID=933084 RepID=A0A067PUI4_9AGAM|nr:hypothetical protein JAAARDRAFT_34280 [Jaapia argillacea MUCL 33604]
MTRPRKARNGATPSPSQADDNEGPTASTSTTRPLSLLNLALSPSERDEVKVNNSNLTDLKNACDDAVKRFLSRPDLFKQIHTHTDVRLALGWASVFVAAGTAYYGWKVEFEQSKPVVWAGLIIYVLLTALQALYAYFVEGDVVFVGKRKTFEKRIVTERITLSSHTTPSKSSKPPSYHLTATYVRSASGGKSLLNRGNASQGRGYTTFFDEKGTMDQERFETWVAELVDKVTEDKSQ